MTFEKIEQFSQNYEIFEYSQIPFKRDLFIFGDDDKDKFINGWYEFLSSPDKSNQEYPENYFKFRWCSIEKIAEDSIDVNICITFSERFHGIIKKLPRSKFVSCIDIWNYHSKPYLIVSQDWFNSIEQELFSNYAYIDIIGMKKLINKFGSIPSSMISELNKGMEKVIETYTDYFFIVFADNIIVKSNWNANPSEYTKTYEPEKLILIVNELFKIIKKAFGLDAYAIITQGANLTDNQHTKNLRNYANYIFFDTISLPFSEILEIENKIKENKRFGNLYLSKSFLLTLNFLDHKRSDYYRNKLVRYETKNILLLNSSYLIADINGIVADLNFN